MFFSSALKEQKKNMQLTMKQHLILSLIYKQLFNYQCNFALQCKFMHVTL
jgi:hypothetical protein